MPNAHQQKGSAAIAPKKKGAPDALDAAGPGAMPGVGGSGLDLAGLLGSGPSKALADGLLSLGSLVVGPTALPPDGKEDKGGDAAASSEGKETERLPAGPLLAKLDALEKGGEGGGSGAGGPAAGAAKAEAEPKPIDLGPLGKAAGAVAEAGKKVIADLQAMIAQGKKDDAAAKKDGAAAKKDGASGGPSAAGGAVSAGALAGAKAGGAGEPGAKSEEKGATGKAATGKVGEALRGVLTALAEKAAGMQPGGLEMTQIKEKDAEKLKTAQTEIEKYQKMLADEEARIKKQAEEDLAKAPAEPTEAMVAYKFMEDLKKAHDTFYRIDLGDGIKVPVPYMVNYTSDEWTGRKQSEARKVLAKSYGSKKEEFLYTRLGKGTAEDNQKVLKHILQTQPWTKLSKSSKAAYDKKVAAMLPPNATKEQKLAIQTLAFAQVAGIGTDCAGYVEHTLKTMGLIPKTAYDTGVTNLTSSLGTEVKGSRGKKLVRPCNDAGEVVVKAGDMIKIRGDGHIGLVHAVVANGDEIVVKYAHCTPGQAVYGVTGQIGVKPEGLREDIIVWNTKTNKWKSVRAAYPTYKLNAGLISGFYSVNAAKATKFAEKYPTPRKDL